MYHHDHAAKNCVFRLYLASCLPVSFLGVTRSSLERGQSAPSQLKAWLWRSVRPRPAPTSFSAISWRHHCTQAI